VAVVLEIVVAAVVVVVIAVVAVEGGGRERREIRREGRVQPLESRDLAGVSVEHRPRRPRVVVVTLVIVVLPLVVPLLVVVLLAPTRATVRGPLGARGSGAVFVLLGRSR
jgi:hypothetical protein